MVNEFLDKLNMNTYKTLVLTSKNMKIVNNLKKDFDTTVTLSNAILCLVDKKQKNSFFTKHILAFENPEQTLSLSMEIEKIFKLQAKESLLLSTQIMCNSLRTDNYIENVLNMIYNFTTITRDESIVIIQKNPKFLALDMKICYKNFETLVNKFHIKQSTLKHIFNICPLFFAKNDLLSVVYMIKRTLSLSSVELDYFLLNNYNVCLAPILKLRENISVLIKNFSLNDSSIINLIRTNPKFLILPKNTLLNLSKTLIKKFAIHESEIASILFKCPQIVNYPINKIIDNCNYLLSMKLFVKKDLNNIILSSPEVILYSHNKIEKQILNIVKTFNCKTKNDLIRIIRECPSIISYNPIENRFNEFEKYGINHNYIKLVPSILSQNALIAGVKQMILTPFNLSYDLDMVTYIDSIELLTRIKFISNNNLNPEKILSPQNIFNQTYKTSIQDLMSTSPLLSTEITKIIKNTNSHIPASVNQRIKQFFFFSYISAIKNLLASSNQNITNKEKIVTILNILGLDHDRCKDIANMLHTTTLYSSVLSTIEKLHAFRLTREQIIKLIERKPVILASSIKALDDSYRDLSNQYNNIASVIVNLL